MNPNKVAIFLDSGSPSRLRQAATILVSSAVLNWEVTVILLGEALRKFVEGRLDEPSDGEKEAASPEESSAQALFQEARVLGKVTFLACSADARTLGIDRGDLEKSVDEIVGMTTILRRTRDAGTKLYI